MTSSNPGFSRGFWVFKQGDFGIFLSKDHHIGVTVQLVRMVKSTKPNAAGTGYEEFEQPAILAAQAVAVEDKMGPKFKEAVNASIAVLKKTLAKLVEQEAMIDGALADFKSASKAFN